MFSKINPFLLLIIFSLVFFSCNKNNSIDLLFEQWTLVEKAITEIDGEEAENFTKAKKSDSETKAQIQFEKFLNEFENFQASAIYKNLIMSEDYGFVLQKLEKEIQTKDINKIRISLFELEETDKYLTQKSNEEYYILAQLLIIFIILISIMLYINFRRLEKKQNEAKQLGIYSDFMIKGMETERTRISKEIHDTILQDLKVLSLKTELINSTDSIEENEKIKKSLLLQVNLCIKQLRSICSNLTPVEFKNYNKDANGFIMALQNLTEQFTDKNGTPCLLKIQDNLDISSLNKWQTINLFRIIQEALNNADKHSKATNVSIIITNSTSDNGGKTLKIFITDNGVGFDLKSGLMDSAIYYRHFGLSNMKERAKDIGAIIEIFSEPEGGTEIKLEVPLK